MHVCEELPQNLRKTIDSRSQPSEIDLVDKGRLWSLKYALFTSITSLLKTIFQIHCFIGNRARIGKGGFSHAAIRECMVLPTP